MPKLHWLSEIARGTPIELSADRMGVGRALDNLIRLDEDTISQRHAELVVEGGLVRLRDLGSTNGTRVNGRRIVEATLAHGDRICFGAVEMRFESEVGPASEPSRATPEQQSAARKRHDDLQKLFNSRHHALAEAQVTPDPSRCVQCGICSYNCPAGIDVRAHAWRGRAIFDSHCLTCSECVNRCPRGVLRFEVLPLFSGQS